MNMACWIKHDWVYSDSNPSISLFRKCSRCGKEQAKSLRGIWVDVFKKRKNDEKVDDDIDDSCDGW